MEVLIASRHKVDQRPGLVESARRKSSVHGWKCLPRTTPAVGAQERGPKWRVTLHIGGGGTRVWEKIQAVEVLSTLCASAWAAPCPSGRDVHSRQFFFSFPERRARIIMLITWHGRPPPPLIDSAQASFGLPSRQVVTADWENGGEGEEREGGVGGEKSIDAFDVMSLFQ